MSKKHLAVIAVVLIMATQIRTVHEESCGNDAVLHVNCIRPLWAKPLRDHFDSETTAAMAYALAYTAPCIIPPKETRVFRASRTVSYDLCIFFTKRGNS